MRKTAPTAATERLGAGISADPRAAAQALARARTQHAIAAGDYDALLDPAHWRLLDAAAAAEPDGFQREIGALRVVMARLLAEEDDPGKLATHLSRLTMTIVRARLAQATLAAGADDPLRRQLLSLLAEEERDDEDARTGVALGGGHP